MMIQLAVFDLDCTLAMHGKGLTAQDICLLRELEQCGVRIVICSGKPVYYLCGMFRQVELDDPIFIGEVGAAVQFGVHLPPKEHFHLPYDKRCDTLFARLKEEISAAIDGIWFQPGEVNLSPFPRSDAEFHIINDIIQRHPELAQTTNIYYYSDAIDFVPKGIDKGSAVKALAKRLQLSTQEIVAVGDSPSDYSMFRFAGESFLIGNRPDANATHCVENVTDALEKILRRFP